jgi:hypothetical protein
MIDFLNFCNKNECAALCCCSLHLLGIAYGMFWLVGLWDHYTIYRYMGGNIVALMLIYSTRDIQSLSESGCPLLRDPVRLSPKAQHTVISQTIRT